jgi:hypothetical protein
MGGLAAASCFFRGLYLSVGIADALSVHKDAREAIRYNVGLGSVSSDDSTKPLLRYCKDKSRASLRFLPHRSELGLVLSLGSWLATTPRRAIWILRALRICIHQPQFYPLSWPRSRASQPKRRVHTRGHPATTVM